MTPTTTTEEPVQTTEPAENQPATPETTAAEPAKEAPTEQQLQQQRRAFMSKMFPGTEPPPDEPVEPMEDPKPEPDKPAEPEVKPEPKADKPDKLDKPEPEPAKPVKDKSGITDDDLDRIADRVARRDDEPVEDVPALPTPEIPNLSKRDQKKLAVFNRMAEQDPAYRGLGDQMVGFWKQEETYRANWEKENPGEKFDPTASDHDEFYKTVPKYDEDLFEEAKEAIIEDRAVARAKAESDQEIERIRTEARIKDEAPVVRRRAQEAVIRMMETATPDELKALIMKDGKLEITKETIDALKEADPVAFEVLDENTEQLELMTEELERITRYPKHYRLDTNRVVKLASTGEEFSPGGEMLRAAIGLEQRIAELPKDESMRDGKRFITQAELNDRTEKIQASKTMKPEQKKAALRDLDKRHWTLDADDLREALIAEKSTKAKKIIQRLDERAKKRATALNGKAAATPEQGGHDDDAQPANSQPDKRSVSTASSSDRLNNVGSGGAGAPEKSKAIDAAMGWT